MEPAGPSPLRASLSPRMEPCLHLSSSAAETLVLQPRVRKSGLGVQKNVGVLLGWGVLGGISQQKRGTRGVGREEEEEERKSEEAAAGTQTARTICCGCFQSLGFAAAPLPRLLCRSCR